MPSSLRKKWVESRLWGKSAFLWGKRINSFNGPSRGHEAVGAKIFPETLPAQKTNNQVGTWEDVAWAPSIVSYRRVPVYCGAALEHVVDSIQRLRPVDTHVQFADWLERWYSHYDTNRPRFIHAQTDQSWVNLSRAAETRESSWNENLWMQSTDLQKRWRAILWMLTNFVKPWSVLFKYPFFLLSPLFHLVLPSECADHQIHPSLQATERRQCSVLLPIPKRQVSDPNDVVDVLVWRCWSSAWIVDFVTICICLVIYLSRLLVDLLDLLYNRMPPKYTPIQNSRYTKDLNCSLKLHYHVKICFVWKEFF